MLAIKQWSTLFSTRISLPISILHTILCVLFFLSGCSALIYQVIWQRVLFTLFGVDLESITIIISVFMFGLGVGGLYGGVLADSKQGHLLTLYIMIELGVAIFGLFSLQIINIIGDAITSESQILTAAFSFFILFIPTFLMGATFPILVTHINHVDKNIGCSVGKLYFANTLGGAIGAYFSGFVLLYSMDIIGTIHCAVFLNFAIAIFAFILFRK